MSKDSTSIHIFSKTDKGVEREHNEDYHTFSSDVSKNEWDFFESKAVEKLGSLGSVLVVADGMGGMNAGEVASMLAIDGVKEYFNKTISILPSIETTKVEKYLKDSILYANDKIISHQKTNPETEGMGTTLVVAWVLGNTFYVAWCGDSRCYIYNPNTGLNQVSKDHSHVQSLIDKGKLTKEQAFYHPDSNIVTQSLGDSKHLPKPDFKEQLLEVGDRIILCSDGLNSMLQDSQILEVIQQHNSIDECSKALIDAANEAGGNDNITVVVCDIVTVSSEVIKKTFFNASKKYLISSLVFLFLIAALFIGYKKIGNLQSSKSSLSAAKSDSLKIKEQQKKIDSLQHQQDSFKKVKKQANTNKIIDLGQIGPDLKKVDTTATIKEIKDKLKVILQLLNNDKNKAIDLVTNVKKIQTLTSSARIIQEIEKLKYEGDNQELIDHFKQIQDLKTKLASSKISNSKPAKDQSAKYSKIELTNSGYYKAQDKTSKLWGFLNSEYTVVVKCRYKFVTNFSEGLFAVKSDKGWGYVDTSDMEIIKCLYKEAELFKDGKAKVTDNSNLTFFINKKGVKTN